MRSCALVQSGKHLNSGPRKLPALDKMTEERKFAILFAATILAARKLIDLDPNKPNMAKGFFVDRAIDDAMFILERIDARWPAIVNSFSAKEP